jgi:AAA+ superfamily predicted ATPase
MRTLAANDEPLPKGIQAIHSLPDKFLDDCWTSIVLDESIKTALLSQAVLNFTLRGKVDRSVIPLHGVILLVGPPGTGKTTLARGLASRVAKSFSGAKFRLLEVEPHTLTSAAMGKTQRAVSELFSQTISEAAMAGPTIVLLDEVETLAVDRAKLSMDANPIDIHRATDAVLVQLDWLAERHPNILFVATSNFPQAIDAAFTSRCDLIVDVPMPDAKACETILRDCFEGLGRTYPALGKLPRSPGFAQCAKACVGLDGRSIRKLVANALAASPQVALNPETMGVDHLLSAALAAKKVREGRSK